MIKRTSAYIFAALISLSGTCHLHAQNSVPQSEGEAREQAEAMLGKPVPWVSGFSVSADLVGPAMLAFNSKYSQIEVAGRLHLKDSYFPIVEIGYGRSDYTHDETFNTYKTQAPYFRIGVDYSFNKKKRTGNRVYAGIRYGFSSFKYDIGSPAFQDPVWGTPIPFDYRGLRGKVQWGELVFGVQARLWSIFHLGWSVRYKVRFSNKGEGPGGAWYVPGFGKNDTSGLGGTVNVIFEI